jgi:multisubunit Na+/H+ antiporter MnhG subunit
MIRAILVDGGLGIGLIMAIAAVIGLFASRTVYDRLHYTSLLTSIGSPCIGAAVCVNERFGPGGWKALWISFVLLGMSSVLTHATARVERARTVGL